MNIQNDKIKKIKEFNMVVLAFLNQLENIINISYINQFNKLIEVNSVMPIEQFIIHALPLRDKIINRDESYFYNDKNYDTTDETILNEILHLKGIYSKLDNDSKNNIWNFFQAMLIVSDEYLQCKLTI